MVRFAAPMTRYAGTRQSNAGFTLIEILLATTLITAGLALGFATVRAAMTTAQRGDIMSMQNDRIRTVEGFMRRRISSALPITYLVDTSTGTGQRFYGGPTEMKFVADLPNYLGQGGPHLHVLSQFEHEGKQYLAVGFNVVLNGQTFQSEQYKNREVLVQDLESVRFRYRGYNQENVLTEWENEWSRPDMLPAQVEINIRSKIGGDWPTMIVSLPQATR